MNKKSLLLAAAVSGLILGSTSGCSKFSKTNDSTVGHCHGVNSCKGKGDCGGKGHGCAGLNNCKGKGWVRKTQVDCEKLSGNFEIGL